MSKKKPEQTPRETFMLKLPAEYRDALMEAESLTGRPMTVSGQVALEMYFREIGVKFTPNWPHLSPKPRPTDRPSTS